MFKLKQKRLANNLTLREVADYLNLTEQAVNHYEKGRRKPNFKILKALSKLYNCTIDELVD